MIYEEISKTFENYHSPLRIVEGELFYNERNEIPEHCIQLAKEYKTRLIDYLKGEDMTQQFKRDELFMKVMYFYRNILDPSNDRIDEWLNHDKQGASIFTKLTAAYEDKGWSDISVVPFNYESVESKQLLEELYQNAIEHFRKGRKI